MIAEESETQVRWYARDHTEESGRAGTRALPQRSVPTTHTAYLWHVRDLPGLVSLVSLSPDPPKIIRSNRGQLVGLLGMGNRLTRKCPGLCFQKVLPVWAPLGGREGPRPVPPASSPSTWCSSILPLHSSDPALQRQLAPWLRPHPDDLFVSQGTGVRERLLLREQPSRK